MKDFIDNIKSFLDLKYNAETSLSKKPIGHYAYEYNLVPSTSPYYTIQAITTVDTREDFVSLVSKSITVQINLYGVKGSISSTITNALEYSMKIADLCEAYMQEYKYSSDKILEMDMLTRTPTLPYNDGSKAYVTSIRYRFEIKMPFVANS